MDLAVILPGHDAVRRRMSVSVLRCGEPGVLSGVHVCYHCYGLMYVVWMVRLVGWTKHTDGKEACGFGFGIGATVRYLPRDKRMCICKPQTSNLKPRHRVTYHACYQPRNGKRYDLDTIFTVQGRYYYLTASGRFWDSDTGIMHVIECK